MPSKTITIRVVVSALVTSALSWAPSTSFYLTAVYRYQFFIQKALGNFKGLARLQACIAREIGVPKVGPLVCHATLATLEEGTNEGGQTRWGRRALEDLGEGLRGDQRASGRKGRLPCSRAANSNRGISAAPPFCALWAKSFGQGADSAALSLERSVIRLACGMLGSQAIVRCPPRQVVLACCRDQPPRIS